MSKEGLVMGKHKPFIILGPGDTIKEELDFYDWDQKDLSEILEVSEKHISQLLNNKVPITFEMAQKLSRVFKQSPQFWLNLDANYRLRIENEPAFEKTSDRAKIYQYMPVRELRKRGWFSENKEKLLEDFKRFWDKDKVEFNFLEKQVEACFRKSEAYNKFNPYFAYTWVHMAKKKLSDITINSNFSSTKLKSLAGEISIYSQRQDGITDFINDLKTSGILFLYLPHLEKTYIDGATFWHKKNPVIVYTARYDRNDNFWFTIAHEIGHVLLHNGNRGKDFIDNLEHLEENDFEKEADKFAREKLKIDTILRFFKNTLRVSRKKVKECSSILEVHPAIVIGCLQHEKKIGFNTLNEYKEPVRELLKDYL